MTTETMIERARKMHAEMLTEGVNGWPVTVADLIEALEARRSAGSAEPAVAVKALEWASEPPYSMARVSKLSLFYATECVWDDRKFAYCELSGSLNRRFTSLVEAKAAAQADYEQRIRSALASPPPSPVASEEMTELALHARVPGSGLKVAQFIAIEKEVTASDIMRAALTAALSGQAAAPVAVKPWSGKATGALCEDCPPVGYPTDKTRCLPCPRRATPVSPALSHAPAGEAGWRTDIENAPKDRDILVYNAVVGVYQTRATILPPDGATCWPCYMWGGFSGRWYPYPTEWRELPASPTGGDKP